MLSFCIESAIPNQSPRSRGRFFFDPLSREKNMVKRSIQVQYKGEPLKGPIRLEVTYFIKIPESASKKKKAELLKNGENPCLKKIDLDNLMKFTGDCLKGIVFEDDSQVWDCSLKKFWGERSLSVIKVYEQKDD